MERNRKYNLLESKDGTIFRKLLDLKEHRVKNKNKKKDYVSDVKVSPSWLCYSRWVDSYP